MNAIRFEKFLYIPPQENRIDAFVEIQAYENGDLGARLMTKNKAKTASFSRVKEHAAIRYTKTESVGEKPPLDLNAALEGFCFEVPPEKIYSELVPFGPSYRNVKVLYVSEYGAIAKIVTPAIEPAVHSSKFLGSPFLLDAAFHAACVWGQRFFETVTYPVVIDRRRIHAQSEPGESYFCRVLPVCTESKRIFFNIWIYDRDGELVESLYGIEMRDIGGGRVKPRPWIIEEERIFLKDFEKRCLSFVLVEKKTVMPFAEKTLTPPEKERYKKMGVKRRNSYLSARLALKRLSRKLSGNDTSTPPAEIATVAEDMQHPVCLSTDNTLSFRCSVSHDDRFAIAVASNNAVGVDVEKLSQRVLKIMELFMSAKEQALIRQSGMETVEAAVRIWCIKEAVAKAYDMHLADSWQRVEVVEIGRNKSNMEIDGLAADQAIHYEVESHVFTLYSAVSY